MDELNNKFSLAFTSTALVVKADDFTTAVKLRKQIKRWAVSALKAEKEVTRITWAGSNRSFDIPTFLGLKYQVSRF